MQGQGISTFVIYTTLVVLVLVISMGVNFFISAKKRIKQQMQLAQAKLDFEKELRQVENEVSEAIMSKFAEELHDNIGQLLTAAHIQLENQKLSHPQLSEGLKPVGIYLEEVTQQLRLLSRTFNNDYLGHVGLLTAIQTEVDRLKTLKRLEVIWKPVKGPSNLGKNQELMVFRILQEIIQNALRHSSAKHLKIELNNSNNDFELKVLDDGKGFSPEDILNSHKASGLRNILKRAGLAGLSCTIESAPGKGCLYILKKIATLD